MRTGGIAALLSPLLAVALLAPTPAATQPEILASTCVVAEMLVMSSDDKFDPDRFDRLEIWQALNYHEKGGMARAALLVLDLKENPAQAKVEAERCAAIDPASRLPTLPKAPANGLECLEPMTRANKILSDSLADGEPDPRALCTILPEAQDVLAKGRKALEEGKVACTDSQSTWVTLSKTAWMFGMLGLAASEAINCSAPGDGQSHS